MIAIRNTTKKKINVAQLEKLGEQWLVEQGLGEQEVSLLLVDSRMMRQLNREFRGQDQVSDVLSFPTSSQVPQSSLLGEVVINLEEIDKGEKYVAVFGARRSPREILEFLFIHGLLHLVGYQDEEETERREMLRLGAEFLAQFYKKSVNDIIKAAN